MAGISPDVLNALHEPAPRAMRVNLEEVMTAENHARMIPLAERLAEVLEGVDHKLDRLIHLYFLNRGILVTPFHNMLLISPETAAGDVDRHSAVFAECAGALNGSGT